MRRSSSLAVFGVAVLTATLALAQARKGGGGAARAPKKAAPAAAAKDGGAAESPYEEGKGSKPAAGPAESATTTGQEGTSGSNAADGGEQQGEAQGGSGAQQGASDETVPRSPLNPRPEEFPDGGAVTTPADLDAILGDIAALRARVAAVSDTLFKSRIVLRVETRGDHGRIAKLLVNLDEGAVYTAPAGFRAEDETTIYDHAVAPGRHLLGIDVDRRDDRGDSFRNTQTSRVALEVPENQRLEVSIRIDDDSDMASDFASSQKGSYDLRVRVRAKARR